MSEFVANNCLDPPRIFTYLIIYVVLGLPVSNSALNACFNTCTAATCLYQPRMLTRASHDTITTMISIPKRGIERVCPLIALL